MNLIKELLKNLPPVKVEIIPNDQKDKELAEQYSEFLSYCINEEILNV